LHSLVSAPQVRASSLSLQKAFQLLGHQSNFPRQNLHSGPGRSESSRNLVDLAKNSRKTAQSGKQKHEATGDYHAQHLQHTSERTLLSASLICTTSSFNCWFSMA
jgi:hypothetical protein